MAGLDLPCARHPRPRSAIGFTGMDRYLQLLKPNAAVLSRMAPSIPGSQSGDGHDARSRPRTNKPTGIAISA